MMNRGKVLFLLDLVEIVLSFLCFIIFTIDFSLTSSNLCYFFLLGDICIIFLLLGDFYQVRRKPKTRIIKYSKGMIDAKALRKISL